MNERRPLDDLLMKGDGKYFKPFLEPTHTWLLESYPQYLFSKFMHHSEINQDSNGGVHRSEEDIISDSGFIHYLLRELRRIDDLINLCKSRRDKIELKADDRRDELAEYHNIRHVIKRALASLIGLFRIRTRF